MAWIAIDEDDVLTRMSGPELETFRAAALADGQADPLQAVIDQVTNEIRSYVATCRRNRLGDAGTIPDELLGAALDKLVLEIMKRAAGTIVDPENRRRNDADAATRLLERVSECKFAIEDPSTGSEATGYVQVANSTARKTTRATMDGL